MSQQDPWHGARLHHVALSVRDMDAALAFYRDTLGFTVEWEMDHVRNPVVDAIVGLPDVDVRMAMLAGFGAHLELFQYHAPRGEKRPPRRQCDFGFSHLCLLVEDMRVLHERLTAEGHEFVSPPQNHRPGGWVAYLRDPEGNVVELLTREDLW